jgi:HAD superfamily hydrolase (TIGR01549 family)
VIRAVLFDLFDTLVDLHMEDFPTIEIGGRRVPSTYPYLFEAVGGDRGIDLETFSRTLREVDVERWSRLEEGYELPTLERFSAFVERLGMPDPHLARRLTEVHMGEIRARARFLPHHADVLDRLRRRVRLGVCSNFSHAPTARDILEEAGLLDRLDVVVISEEVGLRKPRREIFEAALDRLRVDAEETLHVGDRLGADVEGAAAVGIVPVWITRRVADESGALEEHAGTRPAHVVRDLREIEPLVPDDPDAG